MKIYFSCPSCAEIMEAPSTLSGFSITCPSCTVMRIKIPMSSDIDLPEIKTITVKDIIPKPTRVFNLTRNTSFPTIDDIDDEE